jgi:hypothetical protein
MRRMNKTGNKASTVGDVRKADCPGITRDLCGGGS